MIIKSHFSIIYDSFWRSSILFLGNCSILKKPYIMQITLQQIQNSYTYMY